MAVGALAVAAPARLTVATYNIHAGAGEDGTYDLARTADAVRALHADVIGLEEVDVHWGSEAASRTKHANWWKS